MLTLVWVLVQVPLQIFASAWQANAEAKLREANPQRYPPAALTYLRRAYVQWRAEHVDVRCVCCHVFCGEHSFVRYVQDANKQHKSATAAFKASSPHRRHAPVEYNIPLGPAPISVVEMDSVDEIIDVENSGREFTL